MAFASLSSLDTALWVQVPIIVLRPPYTKVAISLPELVRQTNAFSVKRRAGCNATLKRSRPKELYLEYSVVCHESYSDPRGHDVQVQFDLSQVEKTQDAKRLDVRVSCSCVAPGTMVRMADGTEKPIERIQVGDWVITHKGRARQVTATMSRPSADGELAWETKAEGYRDPLVVSDDHPFGVVRGHELCACGCGEPLSPLGYRNIAIRDRWARKFIKGHYRRGEMMPDTLSEGRFNWKQPLELLHRECLYFPKIKWPGIKEASLELASLVGYYLAEGNVVLHPKRKGRWGNEVECTKSSLVTVNGIQQRAYWVKFTLNQNERDTLAADIKAKVHRLCGDDTPVIIQDHADKRTGHRWLTVTVKHSQLAAQLVNLCGHGGKNKRLGEEVLSWSPAVMWELVSSYALGDGYVGDDNQSVFSISRDLISQVSMFLFSQGIWHGYTYHLKKHAKNAQYRLNWNYREYPQLVEAIKSRMRKEDRERVMLRLQKDHAWGDCLEREWKDGFIRSLRAKKRIIAPSEFLDLEVDEDNSFIANGCVLHNCPAFLYWGAQWNLHQRDGLQGQARPLLQAPTQRLDLRGNFVICKHVKAVFERILPAVQYNITKVVREREVKRTRERVEKEERPTDREKRLRREQMEMRMKKDIDKILRTKDPDERERLVKELVDKEKKRLYRQVETERGERPKKPPAGKPGPAPPSRPKPPEKERKKVVKRDEPATKPPQSPEPAPAAAPQEPAPQEPALEDLVREEERKLRARKPKEEKE